MTTLSPEAQEVANRLAGLGIDTSPSGAIMHIVCDAMDKAARIADTLNSLAVAPPGPLVDHVLDDAKHAGTILRKALGGFKIDEPATICTLAAQLANVLHNVRLSYRDEHEERGALTAAITRLRAALGIATDVEHEEYLDMVGERFRTTGNPPSRPKPMDAVDDAGPCGDIINRIEAGLGAIPVGSEQTDYDRRVILTRGVLDAKAWGDADRKQCAVIADPASPPDEQEVETCAPRPPGPPATIEFEGTEIGRLWFVAESSIQEAAHGAGSSRAVATAEKLWAALADRVNDWEEREPDNGCEEAGA